MYLKQELRTDRQSTRQNGPERQRQARIDLIRSLAHRLALWRAREACAEARELRFTRQLLMAELAANLETSRNLVKAAFRIRAGLR